MGAHRYGISLLAFNSISHEWDNEFNKRREVLYLKATVYYLFEVNSISLYWQEKMTLLTNSVREKKKQSESARAIKLNMKKCVESLQKQTMGGTFFSQNSRRFLYWQKKNLIRKTGNLPWSWRSRPLSNIPDANFPFSAARNAITKTK